ncbi:MAG: DUF4352 domain-containing protein [Spirochaetaceae bacterium]|nr:DUF4352 domain-containing protein [Spirochaetaceae bacterium]
MTVRLRLLQGALAAVILLAACGDGESDDGGAAASGEPAAAAETAGAAPAAAADDGAESSDHPRLAVGEPYSTDAFMVTVLGSSAITSYDYFDKGTEATATKEADPEDAFLIVDIEFESLGAWSLGTNGNQLALRGQFTVTDGADNQYSYAPYFGENALVLAPHLDKGEKVRGEIMYVVPKDAAGLTVRYMGRVFPRPTLAEWALE